MPSSNPTPLTRLLAWSVHVFTATGLLAGFMAILSVNRSDWNGAMFWLLAALLIDGVDGTLARLVKVEEVLPDVSGKMIDSIIDFLNYALIPAYFFFYAGLVAAPWDLVLTFVILLVSALYYGKEGMISDDLYFVGFPVLWNVVVFFLFFVITLPAWANAAAVLFFAVLHFIPVKFAYPSRTKRWRAPNLIFSAIGLLSTVGILYLYPERNAWLNAGVLVTGGYFVLFAVVETYFSDHETDASS